MPKVKKEDKERSMLPPQTLPYCPRVGEQVVAVAKERQGQFMMYLLRDQLEGEMWNQAKSMTEEEEHAAYLYHKLQKKMAERRNCMAKSIARDAGYRRVYETNCNLQLGELDTNLAVHLNFAKIQEDNDIGDWGNVKNTVHLYEDTLLIQAVRRTDLSAALTLLNTGLCDPTLQSCMHDYSMDCYTMKESDIDTAIKVARVEKQRHRYGGNLQKLRDATKIECLVEVTLEFWPEAVDCSPKTSYSPTQKYKNRMYGVFDTYSQQKTTQRLRKKLALALETCNA